MHSSPAVTQINPVDALNFTFEMGQLRFEDRSGWHRIGEKSENVAEHSLRAAQLGYILACMEGCPHPERVAAMLVFHDITETRSGDPNLVAKLYVKVNEPAIIQGQTAALGVVGDSIRALWHETEGRVTQEGMIAKDADILEMAITARELVVKGNLDASRWIDDAKNRVKTQSAKTLLNHLEQADPHAWWKALSNQ